MRSKFIVFHIVVLLLLTSAFVYLTLPEKPDRKIYEETEIGFRVQVSVRNQGAAPAYDIPLRLGIPVNQSPVQSVTSIGFSVPPERRTNDTWGNEFVHFTVPGLEPQESYNITMDVTVMLRSVDYDLKGENVGGYPDETGRYLLPSALINFNEPGVIDVAREVSSGSDEIIDIAWAAYEWILDNIYYQQIPGEWDAATTIRNGEGGSAELANLFVALMRANDIPARRVSGWGNHFEPGEELQLSRFSHGWAEFYLPGYGWLPVDPAWGKSHKFENFAKTDADHVAITRMAGIHYLWRGPYSIPYGATEVDTDYVLTVDSVRVTNLSRERDFISAMVLSLPVLYAIFIVVKRYRQRRA